MKHTAILIPAYCPDEKLLQLLEKLQEYSFGKIIVVDDGSPEDTQHIFKAMARFPELVLLRHQCNRGKGGALKTGMEYVYAQCPELNTVITADADGQHTPEDISRLAKVAGDHPDALVLGSRKFDGKVPFRSKFGNRTTALLMKLLLGISIRDTQTGLRASPRGFIPELLEIAYNRYEYELEMLLCAKRSGRQIREMTIATVYLDNNSSSHFNPLLDSFKIYVVLFRYILVSVMTAVVDYLVFLPLVLLLPKCGATELGAEVAAVGLGRVAGAAFQYCMVRKMVFDSKEKISRTLPKYLLLVIISGCASFFIMNGIENGTGIDNTIAKIAAEGVIYLVNFLIQRDFIFQKSA